jgi:hypothetical protein
MLVLAAAWQVAQARSLAPTFRFHSASPSDTHNIAGFELSSCCIAFVCGVMKSKPERRGSLSAANAVPTSVSAIAQHAARRPRLMRR